MLSTNNQFMDQILLAAHRNEPVQPIRFNENKLVVDGDPLKRNYLYGGVLRVPPNCTAVVILPNGKVKLIESGERVIPFRNNYLDVQFVDMRSRSNTVKVENVPTLDGLKMYLVVQFTWRVKEPRLIVRMENPVGEIVSAGKKAVRSVVAGINHDRLASIPGKSPMKDINLAETIRSCLSRQKICMAIEVISVTIEAREGDRQIIELAEETFTQEAVAKLEQEKLERRLHLVDYREKVSVREAEIALKEAETKDNLRLQEAENTAKVEKILDPVHQRKVELEHLSDQPRLDLEREQIRLTALAKALKPLVSAINQQQTTYGLRGGIAGLGLESLGEAARIIAHSMSHSQHSLPFLSGNAVLEPISPSDITTELSDLLAIEGFSGQRFQSIENNYWMLEVCINKTRYQLTYLASDKGFQLEEIVVISSTGAEIVCDDITWTEGKRLKEIIIDLAYPEEG